MTTETFEEFQQRYRDEMKAAVKNLDPRWGVKGYKAHETMNGVSYVFTLTDNGTDAAFVEDSGRGGGPFVAWPTRESTCRSAFEAEAKRLFTAGVPSEDMVEAILLRANK